MSVVFDSLVRKIFLSKAALRALPALIFPVSPVISLKVPDYPPWGLLVLRIPFLFHFAFQFLEWLPVDEAACVCLERENKGDSLLTELLK